MLVLGAVHEASSTAAPLGPPGDTTAATTRAYRAHTASERNRGATIAFAMKKAYVIIINPRVPVSPIRGWPGIPVRGCRGPPNRERMVCQRSARVRPAGSESCQRRDDLRAHQLDRAHRGGMIHARFLRLEEQVADAELAL